MLIRFYITLSFAIATFISIGIFAPGIGEVLMGILGVGLLFVWSLVFYVLREDVVKPQSNLS